MAVNKEGLTRYIESFSADSKYLSKVGSENLPISRIPEKLKESVSKDEEGNVKGWWVPVSFYNKKNLNGRLYNNELWENVINNQRETYVGSCMLADHPEGDSDGSPKNICGIWLDGKMGKPNKDGVGLVYGLLVPSGHYGSDLKDCLMNGMRIGTSSSGFGKLMSDGVTVDPDSFMIERLADWVLCPSQSTYFTYDDECDEGIVDKSIYSESVENKIASIKEKKSMEDSHKMSKIEEKKLRKDLESFLEDTNNVAEDPQERLNDLKEIFKEATSYFDAGVCLDLKEKFEHKIALDEEYIKKAIAEKAEFKESFGVESPKDLEVKLTTLVEEARTLDKEAKGWKEIAEQLQEKVESANKELKERHSNMFVSFQKKRIVELEKKLDEQNEKFNEMVEKMTKACNIVRNDLEKNHSKFEALKEEKDALDVKCNKLNESLDATTKARNSFENGTAEIANQLLESNETVKKLTALVESQRKALEEATVENERLKKENTRAKALVKKFSESLKKAEHRFEESKKELDTYTVADKDPVELYFESLYNTYGNDILPFEEKICSCNTLAQAKTIFFKDVIQNLSETARIDRMRLPENLNTNTKEREKFITNGRMIERASSVDRMPKGWV